MIIFGPSKYHRLALRLTIYQCLYDHSVLREENMKNVLVG
jgi:hypothetical protein